MSENHAEIEAKKGKTKKPSLNVLLLFFMLALSFLMGLIIHENNMLKTKLSSLEASSVESMNVVKQSIDSLEKTLLEQVDGEPLPIQNDNSFPGAHFNTAEGSKKFGQTSSLKALTMALSGEYGFDETEALFINSMNMNPDCLEAFDSYWVWVEENCFDSSRVSFFLSLIESSMYKCSPENVPHLSSLYMEVLDSLHVFEVTDAKLITPELPTAAVESSYEAFDFEEFRVAFAEYLEKAGELVEEPEPVKEFVKKYEAAFIAASRYKLIVEQDVLLMSLSDSVFISAYTTSFAEYLSNLQEISSLKEQDSLAEKAFLKAEEIAQNWESRYNNILLSKVENDYLAIKNGNESSKDKYSKLSILYSTELPSLYSLKGTDLGLAGRIGILGQAVSNMLIDLQRTMYTDYQVGTARLIKKINSEINSVDKKEKLKYLYENGYFNINQDLLFSELRDIYGGILDKSYVKNSSISETDLQISYPVVKLGLGEL